MLINGKNAHPLPGHIWIRLESLYNDKQGLIQIPLKYRSARHIIGRIVEANMRQQDFKMLGFSLEVRDRLILDPIGGRMITNEVFDYPIIRQSPTISSKRKPECTILAFVGDDVDLSPHSQEIPRCRWCGDAKTGISQGIIMISGRCPRCNRDRYGVVQPAMPEVKVSDAEVEQFHEIIHGRG